MGPECSAFVLSVSCRSPLTSATVSESHRVCAAHMSDRFAWLVTLALGSSSPTAHARLLRALFKRNRRRPRRPPSRAAAQPPATGRARHSPPAGPKLSFTVIVTALDGKTLPDVVVKASGPVDREAPTDPSGLVTFANMSPGTYRLRFEHEGFITFEKEISLAAGKPLRASASLSAAPPPPPPPKAGTGHQPRPLPKLRRGQLSAQRRQFRIVD